MIRKAFTVWKERKQSHCQRRRKLAFPNCEPIDEQHSDNALDVYFCLPSPLHTLQHRHCKITLFFIHEPVADTRLKYTPMGNHNVGRYGPSFTRRFIKLLKRKARLSILNCGREFTRNVKISNSSFYGKCDRFTNREISSYFSAFWN